MMFLKILESHTKTPFFEIKLRTSIISTQRLSTPAETEYMQRLSTLRDWVHAETEYTQRLSTRRDWVHLQRLSTRRDWVHPNFVSHLMIKTLAVIEIYTVYVYINVHLVYPFSYKCLYNEYIFYFKRVLFIFCPSRVLCTLEFNLREGIMSLLN